MRPMPIIAVLLTAVALPFAAAANPNGCPPGLAKKSPACVPPGLAKKKEQHRYRVGDRITDDYIIITDPGRYRLDRRGSYWRRDGYVFRVDPETGKVLDLIGAVDALLN